jgi:hypothetical protein
MIMMLSPSGEWGHSEIPPVVKQGELGFSGAERFDRPEKIRDPITSAAIILSDSSVVITLRVMVLLHV